MTTRLTVANTPVLLNGTITRDDGTYTAGRHGDAAHEDLDQGSHRGTGASWAVAVDVGVCIQLAILVISNGSSGVAPATDQLQVSACALLTQIEHRGTASSNDTATLHMKTLFEDHIATSRGSIFEDTATLHMKTLFEDHIATSRDSIFEGTATLHTKTLFEDLIAALAPHGQLQVDVCVCIQISDSCDQQWQ